jgi:UDP-glucose 4-epimerase
MNRIHLQVRLKSTWIVLEIIFLECLKRVEQITGSKIISYKIDCLDLESLRTVFQKHSIYAIINCAALKSVGESVQKPVLYYKNNIGCLLNLLTVRFFKIID